MQIDLFPRWSVQDRFGISQTKRSISICKKPPKSRYDQTSQKKNLYRMRISALGVEVEAPCVCVCVSARARPRAPLSATLNVTDVPFLALPPPPQTLSDSLKLSQSKKTSVLQDFMSFILYNNCVKQVILSSFQKCESKAQKVKPLAQVK